jgi:hypothetical protein
LKPNHITLWLLIFPLAFVAIYFFIYAWADVLHIDNSIAIYWLDANNIALRPLLACVLLPCAVGFCTWMLLRHKVSGFIVIALICINVIALAALSSGILREYIQQDSVEFNDHIYYALSSIGVGSKRPLLDLYECDQSGFLCRKIYQEIRSSWSEEIHLLPDPTTNTLTLEIDGEVVYVHQS